MNIWRQTFTFLDDDPKQPVIKSSRIAEGLGTEMAFDMCVKLNSASHLEVFYTSAE